MLERARNPHSEAINDAAYELIGLALLAVSVLASLIEDRSTNLPSSTESGIAWLTHRLSDAAEALRSLTESDPPRWSLEHTSPRVRDAIKALEARFTNEPPQSVLSAAE